MKILCCFGLFFGKPNEKTKAEWVGFLKFEYIWMRKWQDANNFLVIQNWNIEESIVDQLL